MLTLATTSVLLGVSSVYKLIQRPFFLPTTENQLELMTSNGIVSNDSFALPVITLVHLICIAKSSHTIQPV